MNDMGLRGATRHPLELAARLVVLLSATIAFVSVSASSAQASVGYEPDASNPSRALPGIVRGLTVDAATDDIYAAILSTDLLGGELGQVDRYNSDLSDDKTFASQGGYYAGVALDPPTGGFYAAQFEIRSEFGNGGTTQMDRFSSLGEPAGSFAMAYTASLPPIATDSAGRVFVPHVGAHAVQVFDSSGTLLETITCGGCPGGSFGEPASLALNAAEDLYVVDVSPNRVIKLTRSGGSYTFGSQLPSAPGAGAVAVDPGTGDVFVGHMPGGVDYHVVAYDSSGVQFDDFGAGLFADTEGVKNPLSAYQLAVNGTTHKLYVGEHETLRAFERVAAADPPAATIEPATAIGQLNATLNATVNAEGHAVLECQFEYTDEADFLANEFSGATSLPCPQKPNGSNDTALSVNVLGLAPATTYRYRVTAASNAGSTNSAAAAFETLPGLAPTVTTESPTGIAESTATLRGSVNPHGGSVSDCHFELGTSVSYGTVLPCTAPGPATTVVPLSRGASGLAPGTTYHYRLVVGTNAGTGEGQDVELTTASPPPLPPPEPEPQPEPAPAAAPPPSAPAVALPKPVRCRRGFRRRKVRGKTRCVKVCRKGFRRQRRKGKVRCVRVCRRVVRGKKARRKAKCVKRKRSKKHRRRRAGR